MNPMETKNIQGDNKSACILDYGSGNVKSVLNSLLRLGYKAEVSNDPNRIIDASHLVLPGVGSFQKSMERIKNEMMGKTGTSE